MNENATWNEDGTYSCRPCGETRTASCIHGPPPIVGPYAANMIAKLRQENASLREQLEKSSSKDITVSASLETVIVALLQRVGGRAAFTVNELARAQQLQLERRADGHKLELWFIQES